MYSRTKIPAERCHNFAGIWLSRFIRGSIADLIGTVNIHPCLATFEKVEQVHIALGVLDQFVPKKVFRGRSLSSKIKRAQMSE